MDNKAQRLSEIKKIIHNEHITSQEELLKKLISLGYNITQATLSRDLKLLKIAKMPGNNGSYHYVLPDSINANSIIDTTDKQSIEGFLSIEFSENIGVIKTIPAFSHTVASAIDSLKHPSIIGTVAGNDTVIFIIKQEYTPQQVKEALLKYYPDLIDKLV
jgi:transcriptional regulator of arginine metabolism